MRGDVVYRVYGLHDGRARDMCFGAFRTMAEAEAEIAKLSAREMNGRNWAEQYHNRGFVVREHVVDTDFEIPLRPKPRDRYAVRTTPKPNRPGTWDSTVVEVFRRGGDSPNLNKICEYERNYGMLQTFEPFRQGTREFALISRDYTQTAVLDLASGHVIAEESKAGFCPVGFYVPDWWDVHDGSVIPGSVHWDADYEWPTGDFGFVWGCCWGDDTSWKVQFLDLSRVQQGELHREERFGYLELATPGYRTPCLQPDSDPQRNSDPPHFIHVSKYEGITEVLFAVEMRFVLESGVANDWQRVKIADHD